MSRRTVWLASYPKSGNTWIRALLAALDHGHVDLQTTMGGSTIASARGPLERFTGLVSSELRQDEIDRLRPLVDAQLDGLLSPERPSFWHRKIHDALFHGPDRTPIVPPEVTRAAIYVVRDPRDVAVSYAHHLGCDVAAAVQQMADPNGRMAGGSKRATTQVRQHLGTWSEHVEGWLEHDLFPVVLVRYEDLVDDPAAQLLRIVNTLGRVTTEQQRASAVEAARFDALQAQEQANGFRERPGRDRPFFRRGIAGAWRDELPAELVARVEHDHGRVMTRLGYLPGDVRCSPSDDE